MKQLKQLAERLDYTCLQGSMEKEITDIIYDSRKAVKDSLFVCIKGTVVDGHGFAAEVAAKGATVLVVSEDVEAPVDVTVLKVKDTRYAIDTFKVFFAE